MKFKFMFTKLALIAITLFICSCSSGGNPVIPPPCGGDSEPSRNPRHMWGIYEIVVSEDHQSMVAVPLRTVDAHINLTPLLENLCDNCLEITNIQPDGPNMLSADIIIRHPFSDNLKRAAFDVRGIMITDADCEFPETGRFIARGEDLPYMLNPDGYTELFNPTEYPQDDPGMAEIFKYYKGKYAIGDNLSATLNPFVAFSPLMERRMFDMNNLQSRTIIIHAPDGGFKFGYAIDGCWTQVDGPVTDPVTDYPPEANCLEAYKIEPAIFYANGSGGEPKFYLPKPDFDLMLRFEIFDHQGPDTIEKVEVEAPDIFEDVIELEQVYTTESSAIYEGMISNTKGIVLPGDEACLLVRVIDTHEDPNLGSIAAWHVFSWEIASGLIVGDIQVPWSFKSDIDELGILTMEEYKFIDLSISAFCADEIIYNWDHYPGSGGRIYSDGMPAIEFIPAGVGADPQTVVISVELNFLVTKHFEILVVDDFPTAANVHEADFDPNLDYLQKAEPEEVNQWVEFHKFGTVDVQVGDILLSFLDDKHLRRVEDKTYPDDNVVRFLTSQVPLSEAFPGLQLDLTLTSASNQGDAFPSGLYSRVGCGIIDDILAPIEFDLSNFVILDLGSFVMKFKEGSSITFTPGVNINLDYNDYEILPNYLEASLNGTFNANLELVAEGSIDCGEIEFEKEIPLPPAISKYYIPIYPLVIVLDFDLYAGCKLEPDLLSSTISGGAEAEYEVKFGIIYDPSQSEKWQPIREVEKSLVGIPFSVNGGNTGSLDGEVWIRPELKISFYDSLGAGIGARPYLDLDTDWVYTPDFCLTYDLDGCLDAYVKVFASLFGFAEWEKEWDLFDPDKRWNILNGDWPEGCSDNKYPVADAFAEPEQQKVNETVVFNASASDDPDGNIEKYLWDMDEDDDYDDAEGMIVEYEFDTAGTKNIQLYVEDNEGAWDVLDTPLVVDISENQPPVAVAIATTSTNIKIGETVSFDGSGSYDNDGYIDKWQWDFDGNGTYGDPHTGTDIKPTVKYDDEGTYYVDLKVKDNEGAPDDDGLDQLIKVTVEDCGPWDFVDWNFGPIEDMVISDGYAYVASECNGFQIVDVDPPGSAHREGGFLLDEGYDYSLGVDVSGGYAYVAVDDDGLFIIDVGDVENPYIVKQIVTGHDAYDVDVYGGYAYVAADNYFDIIDIDPPDSAHKVKDILFGDGVQGVVVSGGYAYLAIYPDALAIIDINPISDAHIVYQTPYPYLSGKVRNVAYYNGYAYLAADSAGIHVIDVNPPASAYLVTTLNTDGEALDVKIFNNHLYVADGGGGASGWELKIFNLNNPESPYEVPGYDMGGSGLCVAASGSYAYLGGSSKLRIFKMDF